jgi:glycosyltransferase involved in cell wall biosynthesis
MQKINNYTSDINITRLQELLSLDGEEFLLHAYQKLLGRVPDSVGMNYYLDRLSRGEVKMQILNDLHSSSEAYCTENDLIGLTQGLKRHKFSRFIGFGKNKVKNSKNKIIVNDLKTTAENSLFDKKSNNLENVDNNPIKVSYISEFNLNNQQSTTDAKTIELEKTIWFDLTTSMEWRGGVVGIVRAELEIANKLFKLNPNVRFSMHIENGFVEIQKTQLKWLLEADNVTDAYMNFFNRYKNSNESLLKLNFIEIFVPNDKNLYYPYKSNDVVISMGWMDSKKELYFSKVKRLCSGIHLGYLIYDIILIHDQTKHLYHPIGQDKFKKYVKWVSNNCDFIMYGGNTAKVDTEKLQAELGWLTPPGFSVKFGSDIMKVNNPDEDESILKKLGIVGPYIITVGSIEPRKNHDTLYKAYLLALEQTPTGIPQLIICGKSLQRVADTVDRIDRDPRLFGKVIRLTPTDTELAILYKHCAFTVLPSLYEGWSLTLPESLGQGKFCLCTDTPPLREIAGDLVDYAPAWDVKTWADKITHYSLNRDKLKAFEEKIKNNWTTNLWSDTADFIYNNVTKLTAKNDYKKIAAKKWNTTGVKPTIWMDMTLSFLEWKGNVNGIVRAELNYAKYLKQIAPETRFFAYTNEYFFEIENNYLLWLHDATDISSAYEMFQTYWLKHEADGTGFRNPFRVTGGPVNGHPANLETFPPNSIIFFAGIDFIVDRNRSRVLDVVENSNEARGILTSHLIYDFTPVLYPQFHVLGTCLNYLPLVEHLSENFGHLIFGGRTAQRDAVAIQKQYNWKIPLNDFIEFGSDFEKNNQLKFKYSDSEYLKKINLDGPYIITVGTLEPRKNHEMLYKAYLCLLEKYDSNEIPKIVFVGKKGWNTDDFLETLEADNRVKDKILLMTPSDEELDLLYRHCLFTVLPSFYEGWSLTLPESLSYGKFCLTSDVDPLKEIGKDLVEYINPLDTCAWADRIRYYALNPDALQVKEKFIKNNWKITTWKESAATLANILYLAHKSKNSKT